MEIEIEESGSIDFMYVEHRGPYDEICHTFQMLFHYLDDNEVLPTGPTMGQYFSDPESTPNDRMKSWAMVGIDARNAPETVNPCPDECAPEGETTDVEVRKGHIKSRLTAKATYIGSMSDIDRAYSEMMGWLFSKGYEPNGPCLEIYNKEPVDGLGEVEIQIPVKETPKKSFTPAFFL